MVVCQLGDEQVRLSALRGGPDGGRKLFPPSVFFLHSTLGVKVHQGSVELQIQL